MRALWKGSVLAESDETVVVESNHYFPESSLRREHFRASDHHSVCPWKGRASYYDVVVGEEVNPNAAIGRRFEYRRTRGVLARCGSRSLRRLAAGARHRP